MIANTFFRNLFGKSKRVPIVKDMNSQELLPIIIGERGGIISVSTSSSSFRRRKLKYVRDSRKIVIGIKFYIRIDALFHQYRTKDHAKLEQFLKFFFLEKLDKDDPIGSFDKFLTDEMHEAIFTDYAKQTVL